MLLSFFAFAGEAVLKHNFSPLEKFVDAIANVDTKLKLAAFVVAGILLLFVFVKPQNKTPLIIAAVLMTLMGIIALLIPPDRDSFVIHLQTYQSNLGVFEPDRLKVFKDGDPKQELMPDGWTFEYDRSKTTTDSLTFKVQRDSVLLGMMKIKVPVKSRLDTMIVLKPTTSPPPTKTFSLNFGCSPLVKYIQTHTKLKFTTSKKADFQIRLISNTEIRVNQGNGMFYLNDSHPALCIGTDNCIILKKVNLNHDFVSNKEIINIYIQETLRDIPDSTFLAYAELLIKNVTE